MQTDFYIDFYKEPWYPVWNVEGKYLTMSNIDFIITHVQCQLGIIALSCCKNFLEMATSRFIYVFLKLVLSAGLNFECHVLTFLPQVLCVGWNILAISGVGINPFVDIWHFWLYIHSQKEKLKLCTPFRIKIHAFRPVCTPLQKKVVLAAFLVVIHQTNIVLNNQ